MSLDFMTTKGKQDLITAIRIIYRYFYEDEHSPYGQDGEITNAIESLYVFGTYLQLEEIKGNKEQQAVKDLTAEPEPLNLPEEFKPTISLLKLADQCYYSALLNDNRTLAIEADKWRKILNMGR